MKADAPIPFASALSGVAFEHWGMRQRPEQRVALLDQFIVELELGALERCSRNSAARRPTGAREKPTSLD